MLDMGKARETEITAPLSVDQLTPEMVDTLSRKLDAPQKRMFILSLRHTGAFPCKTWGFRIIWESSGASGVTTRMRRQDASPTGKIYWVLLVLAFLTLPVGAAAAAEFSAVIVTKSGGEERQSKIYIKGDKIRREYVNPGGT